MSSTRIGCTCDRVKFGKGYTADQCAKCWSFWHRKQFNLARGGDGNVHAVAPAKYTTPCRFELAIIKECTSCGGKPRRESRHVRGCKLHGKCTRTHTHNDVQACDECDDYQRPPPPPAPPPARVYAEKGTPVGRRHLSYHVYPKKGSVWKERIARLVRSWNLFDGVKVIAVATDRKTDTFDAVKAALPADATVIHFTNDPQLGETATWAARWEHVLARASDADAVLYGHAKGVTRPKGLYQEWAALCHDVCLDHWPHIEKQLQTYPITGPLRKRHGPNWMDVPGCDYHYSGTFYWLRVGALRLSPWRTIARNRWGVEAFPGYAFRRRESGCIFLDMDAQKLELTDPKVWAETVRPRYSAWVRERLPSPVNLPHKLHVIMPSIRPGNWPIIAAEMRKLSCFELHWHVITSRGGTHGNEERNAGLAAVADPDAWVLFHDDDNAIHAGLPGAFAAAIERHPEAVGFVFAQVEADGSPRLAATLADRVGQVDTAQFIFRRSAIGDIRWATGRHMADFTFFKAVCDANPSKVLPINQPVTYYNALRSDRHVPPTLAPYRHPPGVPGWFSAKSGRLWAEHCRGRDVLELGRHHGLSTCIAAEVARHVTSIDRFTDLHAAGHLERFGRRKVATLLVGEIADVVPTLAEPFGAVLIDASHDRASVEQDVALVVPLLSPGAAIAFHDYGNVPAFPDVKPVADAAAEQHGWKQLAVEDGLAVFRTPG